MSAIGLNRADYCVKSNCFGYGKFVEKEPGDVPLFVKCLVNSYQDLNCKEAAKKTFKSLLRDNFIPTQCRVVVINKNFLTRILHLIVRIFAFIFCRSNNYLIIKNPFNPNEILRISIPELIEDSIAVFRKLARSTQFLEILPALMTDLLPELSELLKGFEMDYSQYKQNSTFMEYIAAQRVFYEQLSKSGTQAEIVAFLETYIPHYRKAQMEVLKSETPGFKEVVDISELIAV